MEFVDKDHKQVRSRPLRSLQAYQFRSDTGIGIRSPAGGSFSVTYRQDRSITRPMRLEDLSRLYEVRFWLHLLLILTSVTGFRFTRPRKPPYHKPIYIPKPREHSMPPTFRGGHRHLPEGSIPVPVTLLPRPDDIAPLPGDREKLRVYIWFSDKAVSVGSLDLFRVIWQDFFKASTRTGIVFDKSHQTYSYPCNEVHQDPRFNVEVHMEGHWGRQGSHSPLDIRQALLVGSWAALQSLADHKKTMIYTNCILATAFSNGPPSFTSACGGRRWNQHCPCRVDGATCEEVRWAYDIPKNIQAVMYDDLEDDLQHHIEMSFSSDDLDKGTSQFCGLRSALATILASYISHIPTLSLWLGNLMWIYCAATLPPALVNPGRPPGHKRSPDNKNWFVYDFELPLSNGSVDGLLPIA